MSARSATVQLLGRFVVTINGKTVPDVAWGRRHPAALVKLLALQPERQLHREQVLDRLWPDLTVDEAAPRLHKAAHFARRSLCDRDGVVLHGDLIR